MQQAAPTTEYETRLEQFSNCFKDEKDLRLALIALLERLPNTSRVRHLHGTSERGKDIVFTTSGAFGTTEVVACVVKNAAITGGVQADTGARTVYIQAEQCLDTPFLESDGKEKNVNRVFVITPFECTQIAIDSIKGKLARPEAAIKFLYGRELFELFNEHYPEYLVFRSGLFGSYITDLERGVSKDTAVANLLMKFGISGDLHQASRIYVQPTLQIRIAKQFLLAEWPNPGSLLQPILESDVQSLASRVVVLSRFLKLLVSKNEAGEVQHVLEGLTSSMKTAWKTAFEEHRRQHDLLGLSESSERKRTRLSVPAMLQLDEKFQRRSVEMRKTYEAFLERLARANELAESKPETLEAFLAHPYRHDYSYVRGIAAQMPSIFDDSILFVSIISTTSQASIISGEDLLLTAPAGFGKSSFCRWNVLNDLKALKDGISDVVPVLIPLHQLRMDLTSDATGLFETYGTLGELWATRRSTDGNKVLRRFRLYLDGLDEVPDVDRQQQLSGLVHQLKRDDPLTQLVFTGRDYVAGSHLGTLSRLHVAEMDDQQVEQLVRQWFEGRQEQEALFKKQIAHLPSMAPIMHVPLLATLILSVHESTSTLPESKVKLYEMFISLMAGGWDAAKRVHRDSGFGPQPKVTVLQHLAGRLQIGERRKASVSDFRNAVRAQLPALENQSEVLLEEVVQDGLLTAIGDGYEFSHHSFQEYLAAKDLCGPNSKRASEAISRYLRGNGWWSEVLFFYVALSGQPKPMEMFVRAESLRCARSYFEPQMLKRAQLLLTQLQSAFPGAQVDFRFPQWPRTSQN